MKWLNKMERRFGRYAIRNLTVFLLVCYGVGYLIDFTFPSLLYYFMLEPGLIMKGQVWRLLSWIIIPPAGNIFTILFMMMLYYSLGRTLESSWGAFRYNVYVLSGILFTVIGAFIVYYLLGGSALSGIASVGMYFSTYYINMSIFLASAALMPNMELWIFGMLPIKMKWLAVFDLLLIGRAFLLGGTSTRVAIAASLLNFLIYFLSARNTQPYRPKEIARKKKFKKAVQRPINQYPNGAKHRCAVCGRTELDDPNLEFRYCSKCNGNFEYCQDHLFTHEHVK